MSLLEVHEISQTYGDKSLYQNASFDLYKGEHMGLVGQNGAGKSTLMKSLIGEVVPDSGYIRWQNKITVGHLDQYASVDENQSIFDYLKSAFDDLFEAEARLNKINEELMDHADPNLVRTATSLQDMLERKEFYSVDSKVQRVASGLGLTPLGLDRPLGKLSGGQRAKTILGKLLLADVDVLLLDEPTNFLDTEHIEWLTKYLKNFKGAFIIISHDEHFLNDISTCILDVEFDMLKKYSGNYEAFLKQKEQKQVEYIRAYEHQQKEIKKAEDYINKNKVRASTAAMAKSRQKKLDKMDRLAAPKHHVKPNFKFPYVDISTNKALALEQLEVGYYYSLMPGISLDLVTGTKNVIIGFNGIGKSTLLKTLLGELPAMKGTFRFGERTVVGYYEQELNFEDDQKTPMEYILDIYPRMSVKDVRTALAKCGIHSEHIDRPIATLSGGEQSKVKLCRLTLFPCNFLILDEPTNHLDAEAKESLKKAMKNFRGTVLFVSHDPEFYEGWVDRVFDIEEHIILNDD
ncbi:MAG: ABC-F family ATP-binding cassette domain-containing protein [Firmicutes bacterium]|nr:ABC-F family ATP-binding cassette domain-containing protein [Bacillota bacterium]